MDYKKILIYLIYLIISLCLIYKTFDIYGLKPKQVLFLTNLSFFFNTAYFLFRFLTEMKLVNFTRNIFDFMFKFGLSLSIVVDILFWGLFLVDPNLVEEKGLYVPIWYQIGMHGCNLIFLIFDHLFLFKHYDNKSVGVPFILIFSGLYTVILYGSFYFFKVEIYPFLHSFSLIEYGLLALTAAVLLITSTYSQKFLIEEEKSEAGDFISLEDETLA